MFKPTGLETVLFFFAVNTWGFPSPPPWPLAPALATIPVLTKSSGGGLQLICLIEKIMQMITEGGSERNEKANRKFADSIHDGICDDAVDGIRSRSGGLIYSI